MPFFLDTQETSQRFANHMVEFCSLLDTNHIHHGSPGDLFEFADTLEKSNQLRIDLSALVKSIAKRESDELLLTDMMSIIAASVGGPSFVDTHTDITKPTNTLMEFLLGTGCWKQFGAPPLPASQNVAPSHRPPIHAEDPRPLRSSPPASPVPMTEMTDETPKDQSALLDASSELRQTLNRLEVDTLQVKLYLDSIEQRFSKIEPSPDALPTQTSSFPETLPQPKTTNSAAGEVVHPSAPAFEAELPTRGRAVFSHLSQPHQSQTEDEDFSSPTFAYATEKGRSIVPIGVFLALLAIVIASFFFIHSGQRQAFLKAGLSHLKTVRTLFNRVPAIVSHAPTTTLPAAPAPTSTPAAATPTPSSPAASPVPPIPVPPIKGIVGPTPTPSSASGSASPNISSDAQPTPANPKIRYIPSNVMEGHLLSAPRPEYPSLARINHIEGQVAMQATISKAGSIKTLHVIKGPASLRSAAIDAVLNWRYKPYLVDGRPTEVATTVYVDFSLKPPPAIAH